MRQEESGRCIRIFAPLTANAHPCHSCFAGKVQVWHPSQLSPLTREVGDRIIHDPFF
ncbi:hypothetical protein DPMN_098603 [Dreissena polymorpha]|uniref:Uncharacterized protein n=1 Tax=Dreissena polymorpha TaxID=45954 RepID=A0A9D4LE08_DREPO|nr:hypothetical protein DPMN_098603 [Dreissena polymorpha]